MRCAAARASRAVGGAEGGSTHVLRRFCHAKELLVDLDAAMLDGTAQRCTPHPIPVPTRQYAHQRVGRDGAAYETSSIVGGEGGNGVQDTSVLLGFASRLAEVQRAHGQLEDSHR